MKILAIDTGQKSCSVALLSDADILLLLEDAHRQTHSHTVLSLVENVLCQSKIDLSEIDLFAVTVGPGSFTGLRIGISAVKGMVFGDPTPVAAVSSLEALAEDCPEEGFIMPVMNARLDRVYGSLFCRTKEGLSRVMPDVLLPTEEFLLQVAEKVAGVAVIPTGDGYPLCLEREVALNFAEGGRKEFLSASAVGRCGLRIFAAGEAISVDKLLPFYFEKPKALKLKDQKKK